MLKKIHRIASHKIKLFKEGGKDLEESLLFTLSKYKLVFDSQVDTKKEMLSRSSVALKKDLITCINCLVKSSVEYSVVHGGYYPIKLYTTHSRSSWAIQSSHPGATLLQNHYVSSHHRWSQ